MSFKHPKIIAISVALLTVMAFSPLIAQTPSIATKPAVIKKGKVVVDGAEHPEKIPNSVAQWVFLTSLSASSTTAEKQRAAAMLNRLRLSTQDKTALMAILSDFSTNSTSLKSEFKSIHARNPHPVTNQDDLDRLMELNRSRAKLVSQTMQRVRSELSAAGVDSVRNELIGTKKKIKAIQTNPDDLTER